MNKYKLVLRRIKIIIGVFLLIMSWWPLEGKYENTGRRLFFWSGWSAIFNDTDFGLRFNTYPKVSFNGVDGPYVTNEEVFYVSSNDELKTSSIRKADSILVKVDNER